MDPVTIIALIGLAISVISGTGQQIMAGTSARIRGPLMSLASDIAKKISSNNALKEKVLNAYQEKNGKKLTSLMYGMGFGARALSLDREIANDRAAFEKTIDNINKQNVELESMANRANNAVNNTGSITGNSEARSSYDSIKNEFDNVSDLSQNINGGTI